MKINRLTEFEEAVDFDKKIRKIKRLDSDCYIHRSGEPLDAAIEEYENRPKEKNEQENWLDSWDMECEGMCGI